MSRRSAKKRATIAQKIQIPTPTKSEPSDYALGADMKTVTSSTGSNISTFESRSFTYRGTPKGYDVDTLLLNKEKNINLIFELCTYYYNSEPLLGNSVNNVLVPFSMSGWTLQGSNETVKKKYMEFYDSIDLNCLIRDILHDFYVYQNVFGYVRDGIVDIFAPWRIRIASISQNGNPVLEFGVSEILNSHYTIATEKFLDTVALSYTGYPKEILEGIKNGTGWIQLDPSRSFCLQSTKSRWEKFSTPILCEILSPLAKKRLISDFENSQLLNGTKSFLEVRVGSKDNKKTVNSSDLNSVGAIYKDALNGFPLAVVSWEVESSWKNLDTKSLFDKNKYAGVNTEILSGIGISEAIVTGDGGSGSYAQASLNLSTLTQRIADTQAKIAEFVNKLNKKMALDWRIADNRVPVFTFGKLNLQTDENFRAEVMKIYQQGLLSKQTTLTTLNYSFDQEKARKEQENKDKVDDIFLLPPSPNTQAAGENGGAPTGDKTKVDQNKSASGKAPMPSDS